MKYVKAPQLTIEETLALSECVKLQAMKYAETRLESNMGFSLEAPPEYLLLVDACSGLFKLIDNTWKRNTFHQKRHREMIQGMRDKYREIFSLGSEYFDGRYLIQSAAILCTMCRRTQRILEAEQIMETEAQHDLSDN